MEENKAIRENIELDLQKLFSVYLRKFWLILLAALIAGAGTLWYTKQYVVPVYRASVTIYVNNYRKDSNVEYISGSNLQAAQKLVNTYMAIIQSDAVLSRVVERAQLSYTVEDLRGVVSSSQVGETELFKVYIRDEDPKMAALVANAIANEALTGIEEVVEGSSAKVIDYAKVPTDHYTPNYSRNAVTGAVVGAAAAVLYITLRYLMDVQLKTADDLERIFDIPVLGQIPEFVTAQTKKKKGYERAYSRRLREYTKNGYGYEAEHTVSIEKDGE